jgi:hypothetical protein
VQHDGIEPVRVIESRVVEVQIFLGVLLEHVQSFASVRHLSVSQKFNF